MLKRKKIEKDFLKELRIAYRSIEDKGKFLKRVLLPSIFLGLMIIFIPKIVSFLFPSIFSINPLTFLVAGLLIIFLGVMYPYISWKNKEMDINGKMHFFITHLRVLAISDLPLKEIINILGGKKVYGSLGKELKKASILSTQWKVPLAKAFKFVSERTPSKMLRDFLDRFSQSLVSGVSHREFIEQEQGGVIEEYKTMYESSNENITILNEVYVSLLIAITFLMSFGIVMPMLTGLADMNLYVSLSSFLLIAVELLLLYLLRSMVPSDEIWPQTGEKGEMESKLTKIFQLTFALSMILLAFFILLKYKLRLGFENIPNELLFAVALTPLIIPGIKVYVEEKNIFRREKNFLGFLSALGSISTMRGGKINEAVHYLSEKDYGILTPHIKALYRRLRTRINDDASWEWFGVDTGSNYIQRASEMFREATYAAANPRDVARMITENIRKIRDLRIKKHAILKTTTSLFAGITFGMALSVYTSLLIVRHLNEIWLQAGNPFENISFINIGPIVSVIPQSTLAGISNMVFFVLVIHSLILSLTIKVLRGSHKLIIPLYFVPFVWIVAITSVAVNFLLSSYF
ncbi:MAG: archaellar assembly protein FlaJ [Thermoplasmata archaeon]|nr:archaellar assembly protein FlaJ [Thermoplasmata archaeon]